MLDIIIVVGCLFAVALVQIYSARFNWAGGIVFTVACAPLVLIIYSHTAARFGVRSEWWLAPLLTVLLLPLHYQLVPAIYGRLQGLGKRRATVQMDAESAIDEMLKGVV